MMYWYYSVPLLAALQMVRTRSNNPFHLLSALDEAAAEVDSAVAKAQVTSALPRAFVNAMACDAFDLKIVATHSPMYEQRFFTNSLVPRRRSAPPRPKLTRYQ